jgi:hypothetical protein
MDVTEGRETEIDGEDGVSEAEKFPRPKNGGARPSIKNKKRDPDFPGLCVFSSHIHQARLRTDRIRRGRESSR